jgi:hypothetical protein
MALTSEDELVVLRAVDVFTSLRKLYEMRTGSPSGREAAQAMFPTVWATLTPSGREGSG